MAFGRIIRAILTRRRPRRVSDWYFLTFDDRVVRLEARPPGGEAWVQEFRCFLAEDDMWVSDGIYVFTAGRPESHNIPSEASGGNEFWAEVLRRGLFDPQLALRAATSMGALFCWPDAPPDPARKPDRPED
jgi:hypothetical protein